MSNRVARTLVCLVLVLAALSLTGCGGKKEQELTPQQFVYGYEEARIAASQRTPLRTEERTLPAGTMFAVRLVDRISSVSANVGDVFRIEVVEDVVVDGAVVIPVGSTGQGRVTRAQKAGVGGRSGDIAVRFDFVKSFDDVRIAVEWEEAAKHQDRDITFAEHFWLGTLAFFKKGENIAIPVNSQFYVLSRGPVTVKARVY